MAADSNKFIAIAFDKWETNFRLQTIEVSREKADEWELYYRRYDINGNLGAHNKQTLYVTPIPETNKFELTQIYHPGVKPVEIDTTERSARELVLMALEAFGDEQPILASRIGSNPAD